MFARPQRSAIAVGSPRPIPPACGRYAKPVLRMPHPGTRSTDERRRKRGGAQASVASLLGSACEGLHPWLKPHFSPRLPDFGGGRPSFFVVCRPGIGEG